MAKFKPGDLAYMVGLKSVLNMKTGEEGNVAFYEGMVCEILEGPIRLMPESSDRYVVDPYVKERAMQDADRITVPEQNLVPIKGEPLGSWDDIRKATGWHPRENDDLEKLIEITRRIEYDNELMDRELERRRG